MEDKLKAVEAKAFVTKDYSLRMLQSAIAELQQAEQTLVNSPTGISLSIELSNIAHQINTIARYHAEVELWMGMVNYLRKKED